MNRSVIFGKLNLLQSETWAIRQKQAISLHSEADHRRGGDAFRRIYIYPVCQWRELRCGRAADACLHHSAYHYAHPQFAGEGYPSPRRGQAPCLEKLDVDAISQPVKRGEIFFTLH